MVLPPETELLMLLGQSIFKSTSNRQEKSTDNEHACQAVVKDAAVNL